MNKKDCEHIAYLLSEHRPVSQRLCEAFFKMDPRIEPDFDIFQEIHGESNDISELTRELMVKYNGNHWYIMSDAALTKSYAECMDEARRTVLGDDYDPSLFRR